MKNIIFLSLFFTTTAFANTDYSLMNKDPIFLNVDEIGSQPARVQATVQELIGLSEEQEKLLKFAEKNEEQFKTKGFIISKGVRKGLTLLSEQLKILQNTKNSEALWKAKELAQAYNYSFTYPIPHKEDLGSIFRHLHHHIGVGNDKASNTPDADGGKTNPPNSTFWKNRNIKGQELFIGFDRAKRMENLVGCIYKEPKDGYGLRPGFGIKCGDEEYKLKWGNETNTEPFNSRIYHLMGYNANQVDYMPSIEVKYNRRILQEFNSRKPLFTDLTVLFGLVKLTTITIGGDYNNPFDHIAGAVLKDGTKLKTDDLKKSLFNVKSSKPELKDENYVDAFEEKIQSLVFKAGNIEYKSKNMSNAGAWGWQGQGHEDLRELRGAGLLSAWLANFDVRWDNNRLRIKEEGDSQEIVHFISDVGAGLGEASNMFVSDASSQEGFVWRFTIGQQGGKIEHCKYGLGRVIQDNCRRHGYAIQGYQPVEANEAFERMTLDDARWMGRRIAQISRTQIMEALAGAGYNAADLFLYAEKLISRRNHMVKDLQLDSEFAPIPFLVEDPRFVTRDFRQEPLVIQTTSGKSFTIPHGDCSLVKGKVRCMVAR